MSIAPSFIAVTTSNAGGCTASTTSASPTRALQSAVKTTSLKAASGSLMASPAPACMCKIAPRWINLGTTEGTSATRRSCGCVSFRTATLTYIRCSLRLQRRRHFGGTLRSVGIVGRDSADGGPIKLITPLGEEPQKSVVQQAGNRHRHALTLARIEPEPDVLVT